ncbi:MAG: hypothetical protein IPJ88_17270 [Myxococcales bacterium]|nr:MAG: hypothetical protein IPJ88_17270 [Myxococcales bacterium]
MVLRDLGYRAYEGSLQGRGQNAWVLWRYSLRRAWNSWLIKLSVLFCWVPAMVPLAYIGIVFWFSTQTAGGNAPGAGNIDGASLLNNLFKWQLWLFVSLVTLRTGASAMAEDMTNDSFTFFFSKPVSPLQYLLGRMGAVLTLVFSITLLPTALVVLCLSVTSPQGEVWHSAKLFFPTLGLCAVVALVTSVVSVGISSLSRNRALTMTGWLLLWIVPHVIASVVYAITDLPWLKLASLPAVLGSLSQILFQITPEKDAAILNWMQVSAVLLAVTASSYALAWFRLNRLEVLK